MDFVDGFFASGFCRWVFVLVCPKFCGIGEPLLADRSIKNPRGIAKNLLVKIGRFVFPIDFVILEMEEDHEVPLILGRPFLATARVMVDMSDEKLTLRVGDEELKFEVGQHNKEDPFESVDMIDNNWEFSFQRSKKRGYETPSAPPS